MSSYRDPNGKRIPSADSFGLNRLEPPRNTNEHLAMSMAEAWTQGYAGPPARVVEEESSLSECWQILRARKKGLLVCALVGFALGFLFTRVQAPVYQALATVEIQDSNTSLPSIARNEQSAQPDLVLSDLQTQIRLLHGQTLALRTMDEIRQAAARSGRELQVSQSPVARLLGFRPPSPQNAAKRQLLDVADSVNVRSAGISRVLEIRADSTDPQLAADYANTLIDEYIKQNVEERMKLNQRTNDWLEQQMEEMRQKLAGSEYALQDYARANGLLFTGGTATDQSKSNISEEKLREVQEALSTATADRVVKEANYRIASSSPPDALADVLNDPNLRALRTKITDLKGQLADLMGQYTSEFPKVQRLQQEIKSLEDAFEHQRLAVLGKIKTDYDSAVLREGMLLGEYHNQAHTVTRDSEKAIQYQLLSHEVDSNRQVYDAMLQRVKQSRIDAALKASNVRKVDAALVPKIPYRPRTKMDSAVGMLLGLFFGAGLVIMVDRADRSIRSPGQIVASLPVPELGVIPSLAARPKVLSRIGFGNGTSPMIAESFGVVMTSLLISAQNGSGWHTVVCTSTNAAEGKTTVVSNLAMALSNIGKRVLLIDADLPRPSLHEVFGVSNEIGLTTLLRNRVMTPTAIHAAIQRTRQGISVLPAGPVVPNSPNLLFGTQMAELLTKLKEEYDSILIDTPPTPQLPHARLLGRLADGVILVVRAGKTPREAVSGALQRFAIDRIAVLGTVLNDWNPSRSPGNYYSSYTRRNGHGTPAPIEELMNVGSLSEDE